MKLREKYGESITEWEAKQELEEYGIPTVNEKLAGNPEEAESIAEEIGLPVVLKVESGNVKHKTDAGGVRKVHVPENVKKEYENIVRSVKDYREDADIRGVLVEEVLEGDEFIVGISQDPQFGKVLMFGLGGVYTEIFKDVSFRPLPVSKKDALEMIEELKSREILEGARGRPEADREKLAELLVKVSEFAGEKGVKELDINPLFINGKEMKAADALVTPE